MSDSPRIAWDMEAYRERIRSCCYVCELLNGNPEHFHHVAYRDDEAVVYLCKYPCVWGHVLVAPVEHKEHLADDFTVDQYLALQRIVHRASRALTSIVETERLYLLSLGSQQGNRHVHLHLVPLPSGVPYDDQQLELMAESRGYLDPPFESMKRLAADLAARMS